LEYLLIANLIIGILSLIKYTIVVPEDASYSSADDDFVEKIPAPLVCDEGT
jgi:hypothetical protein